MIRSILQPLKLSIPWAKPYLLIALELILALLIGCCLVLLGIDGGAWILGGILAGAVVFYCDRTFIKGQTEPNRNSRKAGQMLVGLTVGFSIQQSDLATLTAQLPIFGLLTLFLLFSGGLIGYLYSQIAKTDLLTALLATVPGNIGVMASISADHGGNVALVSLVQLIRFTTVILIMPSIAHVSTPHNLNATLAAFTPNLANVDATYVLWLALVLSLTLGAASLGTYWKIPVAAFLCSILVGLEFNSLLGLLPFAHPTNFHLPLFLNLIGQILLGITIGEYWGMDPQLGRLTIACATIPVALTLLAGLLSAGIALLLTDWDWLTCLLVASPGGSPEMILLALVLDRNVEVVTAGHLIRLISINLTLPALVSGACYLERLTAKGSVETSTTSLRDS
ncbi:MAG: AbrB family transcriptional regulator [Leptolyngbyaceae bacterium]|nr:AbrB family transcriptional regulator [Leptolyngbyaceae bacterium]